MVITAGRLSICWRRRHPKGQPTQAHRKDASLIQISNIVFLILYGCIALVTLVEAATGQPVFASHATAAIARLHGATAHPNPPSWAGHATILITPTLPGDQLAFTGGTTIVMSEHAMHDEGVLTHELVHVDQYQRLTTFGAAITYITHGLMLLAQNGGDLEHAYFHHPFELEAYRAQFGPTWDQALAQTMRP